jgi:chromosome segregation ATPase
LKRRNEEIASLQREISVLKDQMTSNNEQYQSTLEIQEAQNNQLRDSNNLLQQARIESDNELALKTNECNTLEERVKEQKSVNEKLVEKFKYKQQEHNELKRQFEDVSSERDSLRKRLKSGNETHQTSYAPSPTIEKVSTHLLFEISIVFLHLTCIKSLVCFRETVKL